MEGHTKEEVIRKPEVQGKERDNRLRSLSLFGSVDLCQLCVMNQQDFFLMHMSKYLYKVTIEC